MTIVVTADDHVLEQVRKQLAKIVTVVKVRDFEGIAYVERDLMLIRIHVVPEKRTEVVQLVSLFRGRVVDISRNSMMVELSGPEDKLEAFTDLVRPYGIRELARTGVIAMARGAQGDHKTEEDENAA